jgi:hypothetical protein
MMPDRKRTRVLLRELADAGAGRRRRVGAILHLSANLQKEFRIQRPDGFEEDFCVSHHGPAPAQAAAPELDPSTLDAEESEVEGEALLIHLRGIMVDGKIDTPTLNPIARLGGPRYATLGEIVTMQPVHRTPKA